MAKFYDAVLNQFVYNVIVKTKGFYLRSLPRQWYEKIKSKRHIQSFADNSSLDQKFELLSLLGAEFFILFHSQKMSEEELLTFLSRDNESKNDFIKRMLHSKCFVVSNKELVHSLMLTANDCHSDNYLINREYVMLSEAALKLNREKLKQTEDIKETEMAQMSLMKVLFYFLNRPGQNYQYNEVVVSMEEMVVMLFAYINKHRFINASYCATVLPYRDTGSILSKLNKKGFFFKSKGAYTINADGIRFVGDILKNSIQKTFGF